MRVHILTVCRDPDALYGSVLTFKTIRTGFPTAEVYVTDSGTACHDEIRKAAEAVGASYQQTLASTDGTMSEHGDWIERILAYGDDEPFVIVDPDVVFYGSMEGLTFPPGTLLAGRYVPEIKEMGATMPERLHPSLLFFPDPKGLRSAIAEIQKTTPYFTGFRAYSLILGPDKLICDTGVSAYAALKDRCYRFGEMELDLYSHIFQGSMLKKAADYGFSRGSTAALEVWHQAAREGNLTALRGIWREQEAGLRGLAKVSPGPPLASWEHFVGILRDSAEKRVAVQVTTFRWGAEATRHVALTDLESRERRVFHENVPGQSPGDFGVFDNGKVRIEWNFIKNGPEVVHGDPSGRVSRYGMDCFHKSHPRTPAHVTLIEDGRERHFSGSAWHDAEELPLEAIRGWDWLSVNFLSGESLMLYAPRDEKPWGSLVAADGTARPLVSADFRVDILDSYLSEQSCRVYACLWRVVVKDRPDLSCVVRPLLREQEVVVPDFAPYWEGACEAVADDGRVVGAAFFEMAGYAYASEQTMGLRWCRGDRDAAAFLNLLAHGSQLADDFVDGETAPHERGKNMIEMLDSALREIPQNTFYQKHREALTPLISVPLIYWEASNDWAKSKHRTTRMFAFVMRESLEMAVVGIALLVGGREWARRVVREVHSYYHVLDDEPFENWEAEHG